MVKDKFITMRIDAKTLQALKDMADRDTRTLTSLLYLILTKAIKKNKKERGA